ncbi:hypothetical protein CSUI_000402, partial [Cystoisospora suis]
MQPSPGLLAPSSSSSSLPPSKEAEGGEPPGGGEEEARENRTKNGADEEDVSLRVKKLESKKDGSDHREDEDDSAVNVKKRTSFRFPSRSPNSLSPPSVGGDGGEGDMGSGGVPHLYSPIVRRTSNDGAPGQKRDLKMSLPARMNSNSNRGGPSISRRLPSRTEEVDQGEKRKGKEREGEARKVTFMRKDGESGASSSSSVSAFGLRRAVTNVGGPGGALSRMISLQRDVVGRGKGDGERESKQMQDLERKVSESNREGNFLGFRRAVTNVVPLQKDRRFGGGGGGRDERGGGDSDPPPEEDQSSRKYRRKSKSILRKLILPVDFTGVDGINHYYWGSSDSDEEILSTPTSSEEEEEEEGFTREAKNSSGTPSGEERKRRKSKTPPLASSSTGGGTGEKDSSKDEGAGGGDNEEEKKNKEVTVEDTSSTQQGGGFWSYFGWGGGGDTTATAGGEEEKPTASSSSSSSSKEKTEEASSSSSEENKEEAKSGGEAPVASSSPSGEDQKEREEGDGGGDEGDERGKKSSSSSVPVVRFHGVPTEDEKEKPPETSSLRTGGRTKKANSVVDMGFVDLIESLLLSHDVTQAGGRGGGYKRRGMMEPSYVHSRSSFATSDLTSERDSDLESFGSMDVRSRDSAAGDREEDTRRERRDMLLSMQEDLLWQIEDIQLYADQIHAAMSSKLEQEGRHMEASLKKNIVELQSQLGDDNELQMIHYEARLEALGLVPGLDSPQDAKIRRIDLSTLMSLSLSNYGK